MKSNRVKLIITDLVPEPIQQTGDRPLRETTCSMLRTIPNKRSIKFVTRHIHFNSLRSRRSVNLCIHLLSTSAADASAVRSHDDMLASHWLFHFDFSAISSSTSSMYGFRYITSCNDDNDSRVTPVTTRGTWQKQNEPLLLKQ